MALSQEEKDRLRAKREKITGDANAKSKSDAGTSTRGPGRPKKSTAEQISERHTKEREEGRRTAGRAGTGDFLGARRSTPPPARGAATAPAAAAAPPAAPPAPVRNPERLANAVMASQPQGVGGGGFLGLPFFPPEGSRGLDFLRGLIAGGGGGAGGAGLTMYPPAGPLGMSPPGQEFARGPLPAGPEGMFGPGAGGAVPPTAPPVPPVPPSVGVQSAEAAPPPRKVKTVDVPGAQPQKPAEAGAGEKKGKSTAPTKKAATKPKKSARDKLADDMEKDNQVGPYDYFEQLKRGTYRGGAF